MPSYGEQRRLEIGAPPQTCFEVLLDAEDLPRWQRALRSATVLERDVDGRPAVVEFVVDARVRTVRYRIRQSYLQQPRRIVSEYLGGDFRDFGGEWRFEPLPEDRTCVVLDLRIDPGRFVPGVPSARPSATPSCAQRCKTSRPTSKARPDEAGCQQATIRWNGRSVGVPAAS